MWWSLKEYYRPKTVSQALHLLARFEPHAAVLAGGTRLVAGHDLATQVVVDLTALNLDFIVASSRRLRIGALTRLQTLVDCPDSRGVVKGFLSQAAKCAAPRPIRNRATLGGTLAGSEGDSELILALLLLEAQVIVRTPDRRVLDIADFLARRKEWLSAPALIVEALVPTPPAGSGAALASVRSTQRNRTIVNAAALVHRNGDVLESARLALGGIAPLPFRLSELEAKLAGGPLTEATLAYLLNEVADAAALFDEGTSKDYRREMAGVVAVRALRQAWEQAGKE